MDAQPQNIVNLVNPSGDLVGVPQEHVAGAMDAGYRQPTDQDVSQYKYGGAGQQALAGLEAAGRGATFGLSSGLETGLGLTTKEAIRGREEANPITAGIGTAAGTIGSAFVPGLEGSILGHVGEMGAKALIPEATTTLAKVGTEAARGAIEGALMSSGDEVGKALVTDQPTQAQSVIANVGLGALLGGGIGGGLGAVPALWKATYGPKVNSLLEMFHGRVNGMTQPISEDLQTVMANAEKAGTEFSPEFKSGLSENPELQNYYQGLRESGTSTGDAIRQTHEKAKEVIQGQLEGVFAQTEPLSAFEAGDKAKQVIMDKAEQLYEPVKQQYDALGEINKAVEVPEEARLKAAEALSEAGKEYGAVGGASQKLFQEYGDRLLQQPTLEKIDKLMTEIGSKGDQAWRSGDFETAKAYQKIRDSVRDFQDQQIGSVLGKSSKEAADSFVRARQSARKGYQEFVESIGDIASVGKLGKIKSHGQLIDALEKVPSAKLADKLFDKKNIEGLRLLKDQYPEVLDSLINQKKSDILAKATERGELMHNKILSAVNSMPKEVQALMFKPEELATINASGNLLRKMTVRMGQSGTPRTLDQIWKHMPAGIGGVMSVLLGHNPLTGFILGEAGKLLGRDVPDAAKMAILKAMGSSQPISSSGFKAAADFIENIYKSQKLIGNAVSKTLRVGGQNLKSLYPSNNDVEKLSKKVDEYAANPDRFLDLGGHISHYLPEHGSALTQTAIQAVQYLSSIKPKAPQMSPFDTEAKVPQADQARYDRALALAEQPLAIMEHVKDGTLLPEDIRTVQSIYPGLYDKLKSVAFEKILDIKTKGVDVPYATRMSLALFLGQPLDGTMTPQAIQTAQMLSQPQQQSQTPQQQAGKNKMSQAAANGFNKLNSMSMTPNQAAEARHMKA